MSYMGCFVEIKAQYCMFVKAFWGGFVSCTMFSYVRIVFIVSCIQNYWRRFQSRSEYSTEPFGLRSLAPLSVYFPASLFHRLSSYTSFTYHLPAKTFTIEPLSFTLSLLLHALSTSSSAPLPCLDTAHEVPRNYFASVSD